MFAGRRFNFHIFISKTILSKYLTMLEYDFQLKLVQETEILGNYTARSEHEFLQQYSYQQEGGRWKNLRHCQNMEIEISLNCV